MDRNDVLAVSALLELIVALRKESVDRNTTLPSFYGFSKVALRKESVDRNSTYVTRLPRAQGRSPQGERG